MNSFPKVSKLGLRPGDLFVNCNPPWEKIPGKKINNMSLSTIGFSEMNTFRKVARVLEDYAHIYKQIKLYQQSNQKVDLFL